MKAALGFSIFFIMCCWVFVLSAYAQKGIPAFSQAAATAIILTPVSMEMKPVREFNILELPALILKLALHEKKPDPGLMQRAPFLTMNLAEFSVIDISSQQFAVTMPSSATGISRVNGKPYITATESLSIITEESLPEKDRQVFKVKGTLFFNDFPRAGYRDTLSPLVVTVNFN